MISFPEEVVIQAALTEPESWQPSGMHLRSLVTSSLRGKLSKLHCGH